MMMIYALSTCRKVWSTSCQWRPCLARRPWRSLWRRRWWRRTPCRGCYLEVRSRPPSSLHWPPICCVYASRGPGARPRAERRLGMGGDRRPAVQCSVQRWRWQRCNTEPGHVGSDTSKPKPKVGLWCGDITTPITQCPPSHRLMDAQYCIWSCSDRLWWLCHIRFTMNRTRYMRTIINVVSDYSSTITK